MREKPVEERGINPRSSGEVDAFATYSERMASGIRSVIPQTSYDCPDCENRPVFRKHCVTCGGTGKKNVGTNVVDSPVRRVGGRRGMARRVK